MADADEQSEQQLAVSPFRYICMFHQNIMEYVGSLSRSYASRVESQYGQLNDSINRLIDDLGLKVQKQLVAAEERALLNYAEDLLQTQNHFKDLKETRSDEAIKQNILGMKLQQEKLYQYSTEKSLEMNRLYDRLRVEFKQAAEYSHELELELTFLGKQCKMAKAKSQVLDQQIAEYEQRRSEETVWPLQRTQSSKKLEREQSRAEEAATSQCERTLHERRLRDKIEQIKEFTGLISDEKTTLERIFSRHDIASLKSEREKTAIFYQVFGDKEFKRYIYKILFSKRDELRKKREGE